MKSFIFIFYFYSSFLGANELMGKFVMEPIFNSSVYLQIVGNPSKPAVLLVHGLGDEASTIWEHTVEFLKNDYYVITFDLPGFGKSSKDNQLYSPQNYAKFIRYLTQTYLKKPFHLIGHSMGGAIVLKYTQMYPLDVESLVLVDSVGILHRSAYSDFLTQSKINHFFDEKNEYIQRLQTRKFNNFINKITDKIEQKMTLDTDMALSNKNLRGVVFGGNPTVIAGVALMETNFNGVLENISQKTTIIWGEEDNIAPLQAGYVLNKLLPHSILKIIPNALHIPILSHEKDFLKILLEHLEGDLIFTKEPEKLVNDTKSYKIEILNTDKKKFTGNIQSLIIKNSQKIIIKDAIIEELFINNSDVEIVNSTFKSKNNIVLTAQNTKISIIASDILGTIKLDNSKLSLAGVRILAEKKPIEVVSKSTIIYSLCKINNKFIHGKEMISIKKAP